VGSKSNKFVRGPASFTSLYHSVKASIQLWKRYQPSNTQEIFFYSKFYLFETQQAESTFTYTYTYTSFVGGVTAVALAVT
jgi:hypothetical protein